MNTKRIKPLIGEVWLADLGMIAKTRPVLVLTYPNDDDARMLAIVAPLTSQIRNLSGEIVLPKIKWLLKLSAVNIQGLASIDKNSLVVKLGSLPKKNYDEIKAAMRQLLDL